MTSRRNRPRHQLEPLSSLLSRPAEGARSLPIPPHAWWQAVGPRIAERARPVRLEHGVLAVRVASAAWAQELSFLAPVIVERLVARGFDVKLLRFRVGAIEPPLRRPEPAPPKVVPPPAKLPERLAKTIDSVPDADLRGAIARAAAANLAWQRLHEPKPSGVSGARPAAPAPRRVAEETAPPGRSSTPPREATRRKP